MAKTNYRGWTVEGPGFMGLWTACHYDRHDLDSPCQVVGLSLQEVKEEIDFYELEMQEA